VTGLSAPEYIGLVHLAANTATEDATELEIACERGTRPNLGAAACRGEGKAGWALWLSCCNNPPYVLYCTACKDAVLAAGYLWCKGCNSEHRPGSLAYSLIEPINRSQP
jgi:hypothetical protein